MNPLKLKCGSSVTKWKCRNNNFIKRYFPFATNQSNRVQFQMYDIVSANVLVAPCEEVHLKVYLILFIISFTIIKYALAVYFKTYK